MDEALDVAAETGWALYELPPRDTVRTDREAVEAVAANYARETTRAAAVLGGSSAGAMACGVVRLRAE